ncbi:MAG: 16S rRNA (guanine(966)-N(2))-methyltransferase RsmD [Bacillota bacterium]
MLKVLGGTAKGRKLYSVPGKATRPPLARLRAALFNIIQCRVGGAQVLDLFAGTGSYTVEALSRGARWSTAIDCSPVAIATIKKNLQVTGFQDRATTIRGYIPQVLPTLAGRKFDLIIAAPPYFKELGPATLEAIAQLELLDPKGLVALQHHEREPIPDRVGTLKLSRTYRYGTNCLSIYLAHLHP